MITGDHPSAAIAIANQIGLIGAHDELVKARGFSQVKLSVDVWNRTDWTVVLGESLAGMDSTQWDNLLKHKYIVFAR